MMRISNILHKDRWLWLEPDGMTGGLTDPLGIGAPPPLSLERSAPDRLCRVML